MFRYLFFIFVLCFFLQAHSQSNSKSISVYTSVLNDNDYYHPVKNYSYNDPKETSFILIGVDYAFKLKKNFFVSGGVEFGHHKILVRYLQVGDPPFIPFKTDERGEYDLLTFPLSVHLDFLKYFFVRGGITIDVQTKTIIYNSSTKPHDVVNDQSGIGSIIGFGVQYPFAKHFSVYAGLNNELHGLILFNNHSPYRKFSDLGLRTGLSYSFSR